VLRARRRQLLPTEMDARPFAPSMCCQPGQPARIAPDARRSLSLTRWPCVLSMCCQPGQPALHAYGTRRPPMLTSWPSARSH
jgi:hypothetical protein